MADNNETSNYFENQDKESIDIDSDDYESSDNTDEDDRVNVIDILINETNQRIKRFAVKKKQELFYKILQILGASLSKPICFPIQICIDDLSIKA